MLLFLAKAACLLLAYVVAVAILAVVAFAYLPKLERLSNFLKRFF